jgi:hypothetical protein
MTRPGFERGNVATNRLSYGAAIGAAVTSCIRDLLNIYRGTGHADCGFHGFPQSL